MSKSFNTKLEELLDSQHDDCGIGCPHTVYPSGMHKYLVAAIKQLILDEVIGENHGYVGNTHIKIAYQNELREEQRLIIKEDK